MQNFLDGLVPTRRRLLGALRAYSPNVLESEFCEVELPLYGVLRSSPRRMAPVLWVENRCSSEAPITCGVSSCSNLFSDSLWCVLSANFACIEVDPTTGLVLIQLVFHVLRALHRGKAVPSVLTRVEYDSSVRGRGTSLGVEGPLVLAAILIGLNFIAIKVAVESMPPPASRRA
jgi:hypothetical protein